MPLRPSLTARRVLLAAAVSMTLLAGCASMASGPASVSNGVLTGPNGMTLYTFDNDGAGAGKSVCNGQCAINWPPLMASDMDKATDDYSVITRDDGKKQWAFKGKPLYYWIKDTKAGDMTGDGVNKVWHVAKP